MSFVHRNTTTLCIEFKKKSIKLCFTSASQVSKNLFRTCWFAEILLRLKAFEATSSNANDGPKLLFWTSREEINFIERQLLFQLDDIPCKRGD